MATLMKDKDTHGEHLRLINTDLTKTAPFSHSLSVLYATDAFDRQNAPDRKTQL